MARELEYCKETSIFDDVTKNRGFFSDLKTHIARFSDGGFFDN